VPSDPIQILADDEIERRDEELVTAYANVACPTRPGNWSSRTWHIHRLCGKARTNPKQPQYIVNVRGVGYCLAVD
jgi:DNA-binding response OmpR family regulator